MVGTIVFTNEKHNFYNSTVQDISGLWGDWTTKVVALCVRFLTWYPWRKTRWKMVWVSSLIYEARSLICLTRPFYLKIFGSSQWRNKEFTIRNLLTANQKRSGNFLSFIMTVHQYQADPNCNHSHMTCKACVELPLYADVVDDSIDNEMLTPPPLLF